MVKVDTAGKWAVDRSRDWSAFGGWAEQVQGLTCLQQLVLTAPMSDAEVLLLI